MMQSSLIGKIEKANRYARELDRVTFCELTVKPDTEQALVFLTGLGQLFNEIHPALP